MSNDGALSSLSGRRVLVVEDEALVAMMIEDILLDAGCHVVGPVAGAADALKLIDETPIDAATLDINLGGENVFPVAQVLADRGVAFILLSGYDPVNVLEQFRGWKILMKPFTDTGLVRALGEVIEN